MKFHPCITRGLIGLTLVVSLLPVSSASAQTANSSFLGSRWDRPGPGKAKLVNNAADYGPGEANFSIVAANIGLAAGLPDLDHLANAVTLNFDSLLPGSAAGTAANLLNQAINIWQAGSGLKFKNLGMVVPDGGGLIGGPVAAMNDSNSGDIRAAVLPFLEKSPVESQPPMDILAHAFQPDTGTQNLVFAGFGTIGGDIHFRPHILDDPLGGIDWVDDPAAPFGKVDLLTVMIHEVGHALGLGHNTGDANSVMQPVYSGPRRNLSATDIQNITELYSIQVVPEPASLGLLALTGAFAMKRRSRIA